MISRLEQKAMELLLDGNDPILETLRVQHKAASIQSIEYTGVGVYINYAISDSVAALPIKSRFSFGDIEGSLPLLLHGIGFILWVEDGFLSCLEIYTYDESWPDSTEGYELSYIGKKRDITVLRTAWSIYLH